MIATFEQALRAAREAGRDRADPVWCVLRAVAEAHGLTTDPLDERGLQGEWYRSRVAVDQAIRVLVQGAGLTQADAARRVGYSPSRASNAWRPPTLDDDELDILVRAEWLHGGEL